MKCMCVSLFMLTIVVSALSPAQQKTKRKDNSKGTSNKTAAVSYKSDIVPIMKKYCLPCHTEDQMNPSELYLDNYKDMLSGGKHGKSIIPGKPDSSFFLSKLTQKPPFGDPMPLKRKTPFPEDTLKIIRRWIEQGAKDD